MVRALKSRASLSVTSITETKVELQRAGEHLRAAEITLGCIHPEHAPPALGSMPATKVELSNGHQHVFLSRPLEVRYQYYALFDRWSSRTIGGWSVRSANSLQLEGPSRSYEYLEPNGRRCAVRLSYEWSRHAIEQLARGEAVVLCREYAFTYARRPSLAQTVVSNGPFSIPLRKPDRGEWEPFRNIPEELRSEFPAWSWPEMAASLVDRFLEGPTLTTAFVRGCIKERRQCSTGAGQLRSDRRQFDHSLLQSAKRLTVGPHEILHIELAHGEDRYVVSRPERAVYIFPRLPAAKQWAAGVIDYRQARNLAIAWIPRRGQDAKWEQEVLEHLH